MSQPDTKERIIDAAESLFARDGFHGTSLRAITSRADVNLAAVNYHFGSKEALVEAVFERRLIPLNRIRMQRLEELRSRTAQTAVPPSPLEVLRAFIEPTMQFRHSCPGSGDFIVMVGRALHEPDEAQRAMFIRLMLPVFLLMYDTLGQALPHLDANTLFWRLHFALGAMGHTLCWSGQMPVNTELPDGVTPEPDTETLTHLLVTFVAAGMEAP